MASKEDHCLLDLLWRNRRGELEMSVAMVIANHPDLADHVRPFGVPFIHIPVTRDTRADAEQRQLQLLSGNVDLVILARYMQILSPTFLDAIGCPLINIHHSFLPAFTGASPYKRARERGVKLIGATAHYVTEALDEGPIIEQDVVRVDHNDTVHDLVRVGATWSAPCCRVRCCGTARTASSCTTTRPSSSDAAAGRQRRHTRDTDAPRGTKNVPRFRQARAINLAWTATFASPAPDDRTERHL